MFCLVMVVVYGKRLYSYVVMKKYLVPRTSTFYRCSNSYLQCNKRTVNIQYCLDDLVTGINDEKRDMITVNVHSTRKYETPICLGRNIVGRRSREKKTTITYWTFFSVEISLWLFYLEVLVDLGGQRTSMIVSIIRYHTHSIFQR